MAISHNSLDFTDKSVASLSPSEIEKLYPMSAETESAIVHVIPSCPVVIDGKYYEAERITDFNGKRLRFAIGTDNTLFAFTTVEGLEKFQAEQNNRSLSSTTSSVFYWIGGTAGVVLLRLRLIKSLIFQHYLIMIFRLWR